MKKITRETKIIFIILFVVSTIFMSFGWHMTNVANQDYQDYIKMQKGDDTITDTKNYDFYGSSEIMTGVLGITRPLYLSFLKQSLPSEQVPTELAELLLNDPSKISAVDKNIFLGLITNELNNYYNQYSQVSYYIVDTKNEKKALTNDEYLKNYLDKEAKGPYTNYWYISFQTLDDGTFQLIQTSSTLSSSQIQATYTDKVKNLLLNENTGKESTLSLKPISNMKFVFALSQEALTSLPMFASNIASDDTSTGVDMNQYADMETHYKRATFMAYYIPFNILAFLMMLALPYTKMKNSKLVQYVTTKKGFLLNVVVWAMFAVVINSICPSLMNRMENGLFASFLTGVIILGGIAISFLPFAMFAFIIKKLNFKNQKRIPKETTIGERWLSAIELTFDNLYKYLTTINLSENNKKRLIVYATLNAMGVILLILVGLLLDITPITIVMLVAIYSFIIFCVLYHAQNRMVRDYKSLGIVVERLSNGNFVQEINEELGMFDPLKENIQHLQSDFQEAVQQEVHSQKMKTELITNVSHDLKTPLTSIISYIDLLKDETLDETTRKKYIDILENSSDRLKHLIENLFDISKANSGNVNLEYMDVDVIALLMQVETECEAQLQKKKLSIRNQFHEEKVILALDSQKTYRIFENLLSNVGKYALPKTRVYICVEDFGNMVEISIKNVSAGELNFDPEEIMERFTRGDKSRNSEGSGLGLAIAKSFTELLGGTMKIKIDGDLFKVIIRFYKNEES